MGTSIIFQVLIALAIFHVGKFLLFTVTWAFVKQYFKKDVKRSLDEEIEKLKAKREQL